MTEHDRLKGDERILGESDFVMAALSQADEKYTHQHELKNLGYDLRKIAHRAGEIYRMEIRDIFCQGVAKAEELMPGVWFVIGRCGN